MASNDVSLVLPVVHQHPHTRIIKYLTKVNTKHMQIQYRAENKIRGKINHIGDTKYWKMSVQFITVVRASDRRDRLGPEEQRERDASATATDQHNKRITFIYILSSIIAK